MKIRNAVLISCVIFITGCVPNIPSDVQSLMISTDDIHSGWMRYRENEINNWGGKSYIKAYDYGIDGIHPGIGHEIIVYSDEISAIKGFEAYEDSVFRDFWFVPDKANFAPLKSDDLFEYKCDDSMKINNQYVLDCMVLQQHNNFVSAIDVRMGEPYFTVEILNSIIKIIDGKLNDLP